MKKQFIIKPLNMKITITPNELKSLIMNLFSEEIYTCNGESSYLEGKETFETRLTELLNDFDISVKNPQKEEK